MDKLVECIPNFSEGRRPEVVDQIVAAITGVPGVVLLDRESDVDHNRSVITFVSEPEPALEAAFQAAKIASQLIDLDQHQGEHPRIGATDVVPFVPVRGVTMEECVDLARQLGQRIANELDIPVYLYEKAASRSDREDLAVIRRGEYEGLRTEIESNADRAPDFGPRRLGKAGATVVGAREALIAFNVYLDTQELQVAKDVARAVRHSSGGLRYVKALGMEIAERRLVQVSMNLTDYQKTPMYRALEFVRREAQRYGVSVVSSEIVGLAPEASLLAAAEYYLQLERFNSDQILERRLSEHRRSAAPASPSPVEIAETAAVETAVEAGQDEDGLASFLRALSSGAPTPGGGSAAALAGALAASLAAMVANLTYGKKGFEAVQAEVLEARDKAVGLRDEMRSLMGEDAAAFDAVLQAQRLPKNSDEERSRRNAALQVSLRAAAAVPLTVAERSVRVLELAQKLAEQGNPNAASDAGTAAYLAQAAIRAAAANVLANTASIQEKDVGEAFQGQIRALEAQAEALVDAVEGIMAEKLGYSAAGEP
ncbi:MAG: glutamate formimidoyltransferase [Anaerolineae bacterium]